MPLTVIEIAAPAKINLALKVLGRRADGYHDLVSIMAKLNLADRLQLEFADEPDGASANSALVGDSLNIVAGDLPEEGADVSFLNGPDNLVLRAVRAFREQVGRPRGAVKAKLVKNIPVGAGLGGGSTDGAAVLKALNDWAGCPLDSQALAALGLSLGADLPFFLQTRPLVLAEGVGELINYPPEEWENWRGRGLILVNPGGHLATKDVFANLGLTNASANNNLGRSWSLTVGENDLYKAAAKLCPNLSKIASAIEESSPQFWGLSGSGPTFWACYQGQKEQMAAMSAFSSNWWVREAFIGF